MTDAALIVRNARRTAAVSQSELARRLGVSQAAVAKLERPGSNPTIATLDDALRALGQRLQLGVDRLHPPGIDESLVAQQLRLTPQQRLSQLESMYRWGRELTQAGAAARGEHD